MEDLDNGLESIPVDLDNSKVDAGRGKEVLVGVADPGDRVRSLRFAEILYECFDKRFVVTRAPHDDIDTYRRCAFERIFELSVSPE